MLFINTVIIYIDWVAGEGRIFSHCLCNIVMFMRTSEVCCDCIELKEKYIHCVSLMLYTAYKVIVGRNRGRNVQSYCHCAFITNTVISCTLWCLQENESPECRPWSVIIVNN